MSKGDGTTTVPQPMSPTHLKKKEHAEREGQPGGAAYISAEQTETKPRAVHLQSTSAKVLENKALAPKENDRARNQEDEALPAAKKMKRTTMGKRRPERRPSIPILPSSDDEFSRGRRN